MKTNYNKQEDMNKKNNGTDTKTGESPNIQNEVENVFEDAGVVMGDVSLNLRKDPSLSSEIISTLDGGTEVSILSGQSTERFYKVRTSFGLEGYCMKDYIKLT